MNNKKKICQINIITVTNGEVTALSKTLRSIDNQNYKNYKNLIISSKKLNKLHKKFRTRKRFFFYQKNSSIYKAMNYGLKRSQRKFLIFLNSGDSFSSKSSLKKISNYTNNFKIKSCLMLVSILKHSDNYFFPKKKLFFSKKFLTHSSFIRPPSQDDSGYDIKNKVTADGIWMNNNIKKFGIKKIYTPLSIFYLGGISNLPSKKSLMMKANNSISVILKELVKFLLLKIVGVNNFYKIIYCFKYNRVSYNKMKNIE
jgi:hypothetical protein